MASVLNRVALVGATAPRLIPNRVVRLRTSFQPIRTIGISSAATTPLRSKQGSNRDGRLAVRCAAVPSGQDEFYFEVNRLINQISDYVISQGEVFLKELGLDAAEFPVFVKECANELTNMAEVNHLIDQIFVILPYKEVFLRGLVSGLNEEKHSDRELALKELVSWGGPFPKYRDMEMFLGEVISWSNALPIENDVKVFLREFVSWVSVFSQYKQKEVFLRELISNASNALDKLRVLSVKDPSLLVDGGIYQIDIELDPEKGTITIIDTGIGMTKEELTDCFGTIAHSGPSKFLKALKDVEADNDVLGLFSVGFYSVFRVAEKVVVSTKSPKSDKQYVWEAITASSSHVIRDETDSKKLIPRGTRITLYLRPEDKFEFMEPTRIKGLVKNYSQCLSFPIYTWQQKTMTVEEEEPKDSEEENLDDERKNKKRTKTKKYLVDIANETKLIWMQNPKEVSKEKYNEYYKMTFNVLSDPLGYTHFITEGKVEFRSLLYIPGMVPLNNQDIVNSETKNIYFYVKRVPVSSGFGGDLFPRYLSFVKGVVDSNVSREILQESGLVRVMQEKLVRKTLDMIQEISKSEQDYKKFWDNFGKLFKLGCIEDSGNLKRLASLLRFYSSKNRDLISLDQYVENMVENQKDIYYLAKGSLKSAKSTPFLEKMIQKDIEVIYLVEPIDETIIQNLQTYRDKKFVNINKENQELGSEDEVKERENKQEYNFLCDWIQQLIGGKVAEVQVSKPFRTEATMKAQTLCGASSLKFLRGRRVLEINPENPIVKDLNAAFKASKATVDLLYDTALTSSGLTPDSASYATALRSGNLTQQLEEERSMSGGSVAEVEVAAARRQITEEIKALAEKNFKECLHAAALEHENQIMQMKEALQAEKEEAKRKMYAMGKEHGYNVGYAEGFSKGQGFS